MKTLNIALKSSILYGPVQNFQYRQSAQNQPKSYILFHGSTWDLYKMTLYNIPVHNHLIHFWGCHSWSNHKVRRDNHRSSCMARFCQCPKSVKAQKNILWIIRKKGIEKSVFIVYASYFHAFDCLEVLIFTF